MSDLLPLLSSIARETLNIPTLETQRCSRDFHEVAVWQVRLALQTAYLAGCGDAGRKRDRRKKAATDPITYTTNKENRS